MFLQAALGPPAGVLERSLSKMASVASGTCPTNRVQVTNKQVTAAIEELTACHKCWKQTAGGWCVACSAWAIAAWWPELEILWIVEVADEQCQNPSMWARVMEDARLLPIEVRDAFMRRYPESSATTELRPEAVEAAPHANVRALADTIRTKENAAASRASLASAFIHDIRYEIEPLTRNKKGIPSPFGGGAKLANLSDALDQYGPEVVRQVILHAVRQCVDGKIEHPFLGCMFVKEGGGFQARMQAWAAETSKPVDRAKVSADAEGILGTI